MKPLLIQPRKQLMKKGPAMTSKVKKELPAPVDTAIARFKGSLPVPTEIVEVIVPLTEPPAQIDEAGPSRFEGLATNVPFPQEDEARSSGTGFSSC